MQVTNTHIHTHQFICHCKHSNEKVIKIKMETIAGFSLNCTLHKEKDTDNSSTCIHISVTTECKQMLAVQAKAQNFVDNFNRLTSTHFSELQFSLILIPAKTKVLRFIRHRKRNKIIRSVSLMSILCRKCWFSRAYLLTWLTRQA